jgi:hypothetical protein
MNDLILQLHEQSLSRDAIIVTLVTEHKLSLNAATKAYAEVAKLEGWTKALTSFKEEALAWLEMNVTEWTAETVKAAVVDLAAEFDVAESTARDYCKAYSEQLEVTHPVLDPRAAMFSWLVANAAEGTKAEFKEYAKELGRSDSNINEYWKGLELHRAILAAQ